MRALHHGRAVGALPRHAAARSADPVGLEIVGGVDAEHARHRLGRARVDRDDASLRVGRADDGTVSHPRQHEIGNEFALAAQQPGVFLAPHRLPHAELTHGPLP